MNEIGNLHPNYKAPKGHLPRVPPSRRITAESLAEEKRRVAALQLAHVRLARQNFGAFMEYCFYDEENNKPLQQQWFHDEWDSAMSNHNRVLIVAPRYHGKSTQVVVGRPLWELGRNLNLRHKIICASDGKAKERLFEIKQHVETNPRIKEVFPHLHPDEEGEWSKHKIYFQRPARHRDASIEAVGVTSTATGGRADILFPDDVVDRRNALAFPALRAQIKQAWKNDWTNLLGPDGKIWGVCTLWHKDDLNHELMKNPAYTVLFYAVPANFGSLWLKWNEAALRERFEEIGSVDFNRAFRNEAHDESIAPIKDSWIKFARNADIPGQGAPHLTSYDTAVGLKEMNDYTAGVVFAVDPSADKIYVVDAWRARITMRQQVEALHKDWQRWYNPVVALEKAGQSTLDQWLVESYPEMMKDLEICKPKVSKYQRLMDVTPIMERDQVRFARHLDPESSEWDPARGNLIGELMEFPIGRHDDMVDAFSQGLGLAFKLLKGSVRNSTKVGVRVVGGNKKKKPMELAFQ